MANRDKDYEWLTSDICNEFILRAKQLPCDTGDTGAWRDLRIELQKRCNIPEVWAYNILRGMNVKDYVTYCGFFSGDIPMSDEMKKRLNKKEEKEKAKDDLIQTYQERIEFLESKYGTGDDGFSFEEKD